MIRPVFEKLVVEILSIVHIALHRKVVDGLITVAAATLA